MELKFCESDFYLLNGSKNCMVATYNFGSVIMGLDVRKPVFGDLGITKVQTSLHIHLV